MFQTCEAALAWVKGLVSFGIRPGLERMRLFMERFDHPERRLKFIHVAGTNGKGSVTAYLSAVLRQAGYDVGTFTSPYLEKYTNRIRVNGEDIPEASALRLLNKIKPVYDEIAGTEYGPPTSFEVSTVLAILYFATEAYPDYVVWETGLGGRLDSTNIVYPVAAVITNIGQDHTDILGGDPAAIAAEKAGIIKPGVPVITAVKQPEALEVVRRTAAGKKASLYESGKAFRTEVLERAEGRQRFRFECAFRTLEQVEIALNGRHQIENAALALMTIEVLRQYLALQADEEQVLTGMAEARWPGRLETVSQSPKVVLDGAHNPEGAAALAEAVPETYSYNKLHVMLGMLDSKNHRGVLEHILRIANTLIITEPDYDRRMDSERLLRIAEDAAHGMGRTVEIIREPDWRRALDKLQALTGPEDLAVVTGTLYLISDVRSRFFHRAETDKGW
jgi:dihydrofolate synthase/folylpolyglutamate synthase